MKFLIDRCAGRKVAAWLRGQGHDAAGIWDRGADPGDEVVLQWAAREGRILVTLDMDFGALLFGAGQAHAGLIRLPDVPGEERIELLKLLLSRHQVSLEAGAVIAIRGGKIRISTKG